MFGRIPGFPRENRGFVFASSFEIRKKIGLETNGWFAAGCAKKRFSPERFMSPCPAKKNSQMRDRLPKKTALKLPPKASVF
jgi:hypothetical protein